MSMIAAVLMGGVVTAHMQFVDLDRPGALEALKASNPDRYRQVAGVINASYDMACNVPDFDRFIKTKYEATIAFCGALVKTSYPPQRMLQFLVGDTMYARTVYFDVDAASHFARRR
jgi:hypothetical protein